MSIRLLLILLTAITILPFTFSPAEAALINQINQAYRAAYGQNPTPSQWSYWAKRVQRGDKTTYKALVGAMSFQKSNGRKAPASAPATTVAAGSFKASTSLYPSPYSPNLLPDGTLIKSSANPQVYYVLGGKRSYVLSSVINRWLKEAHFFNQGVVITLSPQDFARYKPTHTRNPLYIGKVLVHPSGRQFYIDDKLRKRPLSASVRSALKFPGGNKYSTTAAHLKEFPAGPALKANKQPGGMIVYDGPYHGGRIWRIAEAAGGQLQKRLYLGDYFYEAEYYPDEGQRVGVSAGELAKYPRGPNISKYPDGWLVKLGGKVYVLQKGRLRHVTSPKVLAAMGYGKQNIISAFSNFTGKLPHSQPISAFKSINASSTAAKATPTKTAPSTTSNLTRVKPSVRALIGQVNDIYRYVFDKEVTSSENKFWTDYIHSGEVSTKAELVDKMRQTKNSGRKPGKTSRNANISLDELRGKWFPYLFYYLHRKEPSGNDTNYWNSRITEGDRDTIQKLDGNLQWLWQNERKTSK